MDSERIERDFATRSREQEVKRFLRDFDPAILEAIGKAMVEDRGLTARQRRSLKALKSHVVSDSETFPFRLLPRSESQGTIASLKAPEGEMKGGTNESSSSSDGATATATATAFGLLNRRYPQPQFYLDERVLNPQLDDLSLNRTETLDCECDVYRVWTSAGTTPLPLPPDRRPMDRDESVVGLLAVCWDAAYSTNLYGQPKAGHGKPVSDRILLVDYLGPNREQQQQLSDRLPRIVFPLGHLVAMGEHYGGDESLCCYCTPAHFLVLLDIMDPRKSVWLARDLHALGWGATFRQRWTFGADRGFGPINDEDSDTLTESPIYDNNDDDRIELFARSFFQRFNDNKDNATFTGADLIRLFSLDEWTAEYLDADILMERLFAGERYYRTVPRLRYATGLDLVSHGRSNRRDAGAAGAAGAT